MTDKPKRPKDANQLAHMIAGIAVGDDVKYEPDTSGQREGGLKGGKSRAEKLSRKERLTVARKASNSRWKKDQAVE